MLVKCVNKEIDIKIGLEFNKYYIVMGVEIYLTDILFLIADSQGYPLSTSRKYFDVLKKLAEETKANIYFNTEKKELHIHPPYLEKAGEVIYSMQRNVEKSSLEFKKALDRKVEVTVESTNVAGKIESYTAGTTGGDKVTLKVGSVSKADLKKIADAELIRRSADMYEGAIDTWLIPFVQPTYTAKIKDEDYPEKDGKYYVVGVNTSVSESGGKRTVKLGIKVSV